MNDQGHLKDVISISDLVFQCIHNEDVDGVGITHIKIVGSRIVAARLYGNLDFFVLQSYNQGRPVDWNFTVAYRRTHIRTGSHGSMPDHTKYEQVRVPECVNYTKILKNRYIVLQLQFFMKILQNCSYV